MRSFLAILPFILLFATYILAYIYDNVLPLKNCSQKARNIFVILLAVFGIISLISTILIYLVFDLV